MPNVHTTRVSRVACFILTSVLAPMAGIGLEAQDTPASSRPNAPTTPRPAHERLAAFEGEWIMAGSTGDSSPRDSCAWLAGGRRHMVCRRLTQAADGAREQMMIYSYRGSDSTYTVTVLLAGGQLWSYAGRPVGNRWELNLTSVLPDAPLRLRQVIVASSDTLHFVEEVSESGGPWRLTDPSEDHKYVRVRGRPR
jgi:hypothetical protein